MNNIRDMIDLDTGPKKIGIEKPKIKNRNVKNQEPNCIGGLGSSYNTMNSVLEPI